MKKSENLEDLRSQILNRETEQLLENQQELYESMMSNEFVNYKNQLPIEVFENVFLNYFRTFETTDKKDSHLLYKWLEISGGYYKEVDLINSRGEVILTVPALTPKPNVNLKDLSKHHMTNMGQEILDDMKISKVVAENKMVEVFKTLPHIFTDQQHLIDAEVKWSAIFMYFRNKNSSFDEPSNNEEIKHFSDEIGIEYD